MDGVMLHGADDVRCAGSRIAQAASDMRGAAATIDMTATQFLSRLEEFVERFEAACETLKGDD